jgi:hypothetical protein
MKPIAKIAALFESPYQQVGELGLNAVTRAFR